MVYSKASRVSMSVVPSSRRSSTPGRFWLHRALARASRRVAASGIYQKRPPPMRMDVRRMRSII